MNRVEHKGTASRIALETAPLDIFYWRLLWKDAFLGHRLLAYSDVTNMVLHVQFVLNVALRMLMPKVRLSMLMLMLDYPKNRFDRETGGAPDTQRDAEMPITSLLSQSEGITPAARQLRQALA